MKKTSLYIEPDVDFALVRIAEAEGKSKAQVMREALADKAAKAPLQPRLSVGILRDGPADLSRNVDRYLADTGFGKD